MYDMDLSLQTPDEFPAFPFTPYGIQLDLVRQVFASIESKKVAIMESPTGTVGRSCTISDQFLQLLNVHRARL